METLNCSWTLLYKKTLPAVWNKLEQIEDDDKKPQLLFFPDRDTLASIFKITNLTGHRGS